MKKEKTIKNRDYKTRQQIGLIIIATSLFLGLMSWLQISDFTRQQFNSVCREVNYSDCMRWFWQTEDYFFGVTIIAAIVLVINSIWTIGQTIKWRASRNNK